MKPLIRVKRSIQETSEVRVHKDPPVTRRDFIARGLSAGGMALYFPSIFDLIATRNAFGATNACSSLSLAPMMSPVSVTVFDMTGGAATTAMFQPKTAPTGNTSLSGLQPFSTSAPTQRMGLGPTDTFDSATIKGLSMRMGDSFYTTLMAPITGSNITQATLTAALANLSGFTAPCSGQNNDTNSNPQSPAPTIAALSGGSLFIPSILGNLNSISPPGFNYSVLPVKSVTSLQGAVGLGSKFITGTAMTNALTQATSKLSESQATALLSRRNLGSQLATLLQGSVQNNGQFGDPCFTSLFDPTQVAYLNTNFNLGGSTNSATATTIATLNAVSQRFAPVATVQIGGCDYHDGTNTTNQTRHAALGTAIQQWLVTHHLNAMNGGPNVAKTAIAVIITDGSCKMKYQDNLAPVGVNDDAAHNMMVALVYNAGGAIAVHDLNFMTSVESAANSTQFGKMGPTAIPAAIGTLYAALSSNIGVSNNGYLSLMTKAFGISQTQTAGLNPVT